MSSSPLVRSLVEGSPHVRLDRSRSEASSPDDVDFKAELDAFWQICWPTAVSLLCRTGMGLTDVVVLGRYDSDFLSVAGLATTFGALTFVIVWNGFLQAQGTLAAQAFGAKNYHLVGVITQLGCIVSLVVALLLGCTWIWAGDLFHAIANVDAVEAHRVNVFLRISYAGIVPLTLYTGLCNYLAAQSIVYPQLVVNVACLVLNVVLNVVCVYGVGDWYGGMGWKGSPVATTMTRWINFVGLVWVVRRQKLHVQTWPTKGRWGFEFGEIFKKQRLKDFFALAIPVSFSSALEEWQMQLISIFAANLADDKAIGVHSGMFQVFWVLSSAQWALSNATSTRVGQHLGAGSVPRAKAVIRIGLLAACSLGLVVGATLVIGRHDVGRVFSRDPEVWELTSKISSLVGAGYAALALFYVGMATLSAQNRPGAVVVAFVVGAWIFGVPSAYVFAFEVEATKGLFGIWLGLTVGYGIVTVMTVVAVVRSDWDAIVQETLVRVEADSVRRGLLDGDDEGHAEDEDP